MAKQPRALYAADIPADRDPGLDDIHAIATAALATLPEAFRGALERVVIRVAEWPENEVLHDMGFESPYDLLGLYQGIALSERGANDSAPPVDMIFLYRRPLLAYWEESGFDLNEIVRNTLIHEIGHHFGLSDADMEALEAADEQEDRNATRRSA
ncbi:MAG: metallopeptidase family protein [Rhodospirillaceae bacterium]|nr:metallopeptidase family protein [Rhodospirillaceae bacterium]